LRNLHVVSGADLILEGRAVLVARLPFEPDRIGVLSEDLRLANGQSTLVESETVRVEGRPVTQGSSVVDSSDSDCNRVALAKAESSRIAECG